VLKIPSSNIEYNPDKDELGEGSQGTAFKAKWKNNNVVFKKLKRHKNESERQEFLNELTVWRHVLFVNFIHLFPILCCSNVRHPNCVQLFGVVDEDGRCGYVTEFCPNGSLYP
jgi:serine/threonine protein kinase